jgi:MoxR-like ATPase
MGGYMPDPQAGNALIFRPGIVLDAIKHNEWLIIDELNRADFDKAFGELFTLFAGGRTELPYLDAGVRVAVRAESFEGPINASDVVVSENWRMLATMNTADKSSLFQLSYAFMRRFAFIEVPVPSDTAYVELIVRESDELGDSEAVRFIREVAIVMFCTQQGLRGVSTDLQVGPAIAIDTIRFAGRLLTGNPEEDDRSTGQSAVQAAMSALLFPQFEGRDAEHGQLVDMFSTILGFGEADRKVVDRQLRSWTNARA